MVFSSLFWRQGQFISLYFVQTVPRFLVRWPLVVFTHFGFCLFARNLFVCPVVSPIHHFASICVFCFQCFPSFGNLACLVFSQVSLVFHAARFPVVWKMAFACIVTGTYRSHLQALMLLFLSLPLFVSFSLSLNCTIVIKSSDRCPFVLYRRCCWHPGEDMSSFRNRF